MRLAAPGCLAETCTDSPSNIWIENSSRNSNKSLLGRNYFSMRFKGAESRLEPDIEQAERRARREKILERQRLLGKPISERTLRRYVQLYREKGLKGLEPKGRDDCGMLRGLSRSVLDEAKILKAELPQRSVRQIIEILEVEGKIEPGSVSAATLGR